MVARAGHPRSMRAIGRALATAAGSPAVVVTARREAGWHTSGTARAQDTQLQADRRLVRSGVCAFSDVQSLMRDVKAHGVVSGRFQQKLDLARLAGIEPTTLGFGGRYSIH